jgi:NADPH:quinone reductase-like Zn-dependent oxidoreductase
MALMNVIIGVTAWAGIREILGIPKGEGKDKVVCVSGASGAVGLVACQIAKADGAKVVGIAGKCNSQALFFLAVLASFLLAHAYHSHQDKVHPGQTSDLVMHATKLLQCCFTPYATLPCFLVLSSK